MQQPLITVEIYPDKSRVTLTEGLVKKVKVIANEELPKLLEAKSIDTPVFTVPTAFYVNKGPDIYMLTYRYTNVLEFKLSGRRELVKVHLPYIYQLFHMRIDGDKMSVQDVKMFTSYTSPSDNTKLRIPALPNMYVDGRMCWGSNNQTVFTRFDAPNKSFDFLRAIEPIFYISVRTDEVTDAEISLAHHNILYENEESWMRQDLTFDVSQLENSISRTTNDFITIKELKANYI